MFFANDYLYHRHRDSLMVYQQDKKLHYSYLPPCFTNKESDSSINSFEITKGVCFVVLPSNFSLIKKYGSDWIDHIGSFYSIHNLFWHDVSNYIEQKNKTTCLIFGREKPNYNYHKYKKQSYTWFNDHYQTSYGNIESTNQFFNFEANPIAGASILMVGSGAIKIPPTGWGAVEIIINESAKILSRQNLDIWILNSKVRKTWKIAREKKYKYLFALTTRTEHWFIEKGFKEETIQKLPKRRLESYLPQRNSKFFIKKL